MPASIVKSIEGIDIMQTSLLINAGKVLGWSIVTASTPDSVKYLIISNLSNNLIFNINYIFTFFMNI